MIKVLLNTFLLQTLIKFYFLLIGFFTFLLLVSAGSTAQTTGTIYGYVNDKNNTALEIVNVSVFDYPGGTITDEYGYYELNVPAEKRIRIVFSIVGYQSQTVNINLKEQERKEINIILEESLTELPTVQVTTDKEGYDGMVRINPKISNYVPTTGGNIEQLVKLMGLGVATSSELSSTYSVRGGNYDENLVYVNGIEVYRPFLIRSGQQEGLSFLNSDLAESVFFSSGGFNASYGDKTASVLDVKYKRPTEFSSGFFASLLGGSTHIEGSSKNNKFTYLTGVRYKSNQYLLGSMETKGEYRPVFADIQTFLTYKLSNKTELSLLSYYSHNEFNLVPKTRETSYGTINEAYRLTIFFTGEEIDKFTMFQNALSLSWKPNNKTILNFTVNNYVSDEQETFDILAQYWLGRLETDFGKPDFGDVSENRGIGAFLNHARNFLNVNVVNAEHRGKFIENKFTLEWGLKTQYEIINDNISEWTCKDSSGFSLPYTQDSIGYQNPQEQPYRELEIYETIRSNIDLTSIRHSAFAMGTWNFNIARSSAYINAGIRSQYWDLNNEIIVSPRASFGLRPHKQENLLLRFATGYYYQPPFYRELRNPDGTIITDIKAQKSIHFVAGADLDLEIWRRPFKFTGELYYKHLDNLIPYVVDNVRIRYLPELKSKGYATGIDLKLNGEFVPGIESWANISIMQTKEDIIDDFYYIYYNSDNEKIIPGYTFNNTPVDSTMIEPGYIARPTDQRVNFTLFFQDYFPNNPTFRMHLGLYFGTGFPFGPPNTEKYKHALRMSSYRRVDVGFSKVLISEASDIRKGLLKHCKNAWVSLEVLNLLQISNTASYIWVYDVTGRSYAVPNYLTPRQINVKLMVQF